MTQPNFFSKLTQPKFFSKIIGIIAVIAFAIMTIAILLSGSHDWNMLLTGLAIILGVIIVVGSVMIPLFIYNRGTKASTPGVQPIR